MQCEDKKFLKCSGAIS